MNLLLLAIFGALGTLARYGLQGVVQERTGPGFPSGTLVVNLGGCLVMACMARYAFDHLWIPAHLRTSILDRKSTRLNSSHIQKSRMPSSA